MSSLTLWAISIDEARGILSADLDTAGRLRAAATEHFALGTPVQPGLLGKLGPFLRKGGDPAAPRPDSPSPQEVEDLLAGRFVPPDRLIPAWNLLGYWFDVIAFGHATWALQEPGLNDFDFDLARAEIPSRYGLSELFKNSLGITLTRCAGLAAGWAPGQHAEAMAASWPAALATLSPVHADLASGVLRFLDDWPGWTGQAARTGRPAPDLVAIFRS
ncbi:MAG: hypothetical protein K4304_03295 [Propionicimonas sp.]